MLLLLAACSDTGLKVYLVPPTASIQPPENSSVLLGETVFLGAIIDDPDTSEVTSLDVAWTVDGADSPILSLGTASQGDGTGLATATWTPSAAGTLTVSVRVTDADAQHGDDAIGIGVVANDLPTVQIVDPDEGDALVIEQSPELVGLVGDVNDGPESLALQWTADGSLLSGCDTTTDSTGQARCIPTTLRTGANLPICLSATDPHGESTSVCVVVDITSCPDGDGDGYGDCDGDCDDEDAAIHPGAPELCNDVDDDCDDAIDEDAADVVSWYRDADGDGYGVDTSVEIACAAPAGHAAAGGDCDDGDDQYHPFADEYCADPNDYNCDGSVQYDDVDGDDSPACMDCDDTDAAYHPGAAEECDDPHDYNCDGSVQYENGDDDAFVACEECDDRDPTIHPDADEQCDGTDNDCDGVTDEDDAVDVTTWWLDGDRDGWGDAVSQEDCDRPSGYAADDGDCDDADGAINPGATEVCDGATDEDCDGLVDNADADADGEECDCDEADPSINASADEVCDGTDNDCDGTVDEGAVDALTWYTDGDGDGWGDVATTGCTAPASAVAFGGDCDDADAAVNPGAAEVCSNSTDDDCDGTADNLDGDGDGDACDCDESDAGIHAGATELCDGVDDDCDGVVDDGATGAFHRDADGDGYGDATATISACSAASGYVTDATDCDDSEASANPGEAEVCNDGIDNDCDGVATGCGASGTISLLNADAKLIGETVSDGIGMGWATPLAFAGDVDDDGYDDILVGAWSDDDGGGGAGGAYLVLGPITGDLDLSAADAEYTGEDASDSAGGSVSAAGDINGDGYADMFIGADGDDAGGTNAGAAYLVRGSASPADADLSAAYKLVGEDSSDHAGKSVAAAGDWNGDGLDDIVVGATHTDYSSSTTDCGSVYLIWGRVGSLDLASSNVVLYSSDEDGYFGYAVAGGFDEDGDGLDDLILGGYAYSDEGAAFLVSGDSYAGTFHITTVGTLLSGVASGDRAGGAVSSAADVNDDGHDDFLVGAYGRGTAYLFYGPASAGSLSTADVTFTGSSADLAGLSVAGGGDVDGDGFDDVMVGACGSDSVASDAGAAYLFLGGALTGTHALANADAVFEGEAASDYAGLSLAIGGDVNADSYADILVGAYGDDDGGPSAGAAYLLLGGGL